MKTKKGQFVVGLILVVIIAAIMLSIIWNFTQGVSGALRVDNEVVTVTANDTFYSLDYAPASATVICANGSSLISRTDYDITGINIKYYGNTSRCGKFGIVSSVQLELDYDYYSSLYISNSGITRTAMAYIAVALAVAILLIAFVSIRTK